jgi:DNA-binding transcriptional regulator YiaG
MGCIRTPTRLVYRVGHLGYVASVCRNSSAKGNQMSFLEHKWSDHRRQLNPTRRYSSQREFEADWVSGLRRRYSLSQEALAVLASVSVTTVQNWENPRSVKNIAGHNQDRLRDIERDLWIKAHVTLLEPCPPHIRAMYDLMGSNKDSSAQGLAEYLMTMMDQRDPERARLLHWAGLAYSIADPASAKAREYEAAALKALAHTSGPLAAAIENEILGAQFEDLLNLPEGEARREKGLQIMHALEALHARDHQPAYLWNALEVACKAPLTATVKFRLVGLLTDQLGEERVRQRILLEDAYQPARIAYAKPASVN